MDISSQSFDIDFLLEKYGIGYVLLRLRCLDDKIIYL